MVSFCTLFDSAYISRGLVMYDSLVEAGTDFHIYIFSFDDLTYKLLQTLQLSRATIIPHGEFENAELLNIKNSRTSAEYCWTSSSSIIEYVFEEYNVTSCTYIDADLFFYQSPEILIKELTENKSVLITEHRYSFLAGILEGRRAGRFCVQFITFLNNRESRKILKKWISQCIDWCYARYEDGKFGDQKYLDKWPEEYSSVYILEHRGGGVAPWNVLRYDLFYDGDVITLSESGEKTKFKLVFFHFHHIKIFKNGSVDLGWNRLQNKVINLIYKPYLIRLLKKEKILEMLMPDYQVNYSSFNLNGVKNKIKYLIKRIFKFNIIKVPEL
jgi:hypothetical protein